MDRAAHSHWDRLQPYDDDCSDWVPVIQDNTGHSVAIPRIGWEALVHFLEGDPDRPVVLGRLYNAEDNFPNALPENKTKSALKSLSSPGRNGTNQIELEDRAGSEKITVLAEKDQNIRVANDKDTTIQHDQQVAVTRDETVDVGHDQTMKIGNDFTHGIERNQTRTVQGSRTREVSGTETSTIAKDRSLTIGSMHMRRIGTDDVVNAKDLVEKVSAVNLEAFIKTNTTSSSRTGRLTIGGALVEAVKDQKSESAKIRVETVGGVYFTKSTKGQFTGVSKGRVVTVGGMKSITAQKGVTIAAGKTVSFTSLTGSFAADDIMLKVGGSFIQIKDGKVAINAAKTLKLSISGENTLTAGGIAIIPASVGDLSAQDTGYAADAGDASGGAKTGNSSVGVGASFNPSGAIAGPQAKGAANPAQADRVAGMARALFERGHLDEAQLAAVTDPALTSDQQLALMKSFVAGRESAIGSEPVTWDQIMAQRERDLQQLDGGGGRMINVSQDQSGQTPPVPGRPLTAQQIQQVMGVFNDSTIWDGEWVPGRANRNNCSGYAKAVMQRLNDLGLSDVVLPDVQANGITQALTDMAQNGQITELGTVEDAYDAALAGNLVIHGYSNAGGYGHVSFSGVGSNVGDTRRSPMQWGGSIGSGYAESQGTLGYRNVYGRRIRDSVKHFCLTCPAPSEQTAAPAAPEPPPAAPTQPSGGAGAPPAAAGSPEEGTR